MQFLVIAYDGTGPDAKARRMAARPAHFQCMQAYMDSGAFINGGAILDEAGEMIGSTLYMQFASRTELDTWLEADPYFTQGVWADIEVKPIMLVPAK